jgi:hypothetical protein
MNKEEIDIVLRQAWEFERDENFKASIDCYDKAISALRILIENCEEEEKETLKGLISDILVHVEELRAVSVVAENSTETVLDSQIPPKTQSPTRVKILPPPVNPVHPKHYEGFYLQLFFL